MRTDTPQTVLLADYAPFPFDIDRVSLEFLLHPTETRVTSVLNIRRTSEGDAPLVLDGDGVTLENIEIDGQPLPTSAYDLTETTLTLRQVPDAFELRTIVTINPSTNTALSGLYLSGGRFCTQCEATGFRRITFWPDRPDVMSRFTVSITADKSAYPILLSNGSPRSTEDLKDGFHKAIWDDPHRKPSYLFALCAGDYDVLKDAFTTASGRVVDLAIHVDAGEAGKAKWAMDCLKRAMAWDEAVFGREYDLDVFNIVAVRDFNFGAMENKGLNIFNSAYVLADEDSATDLDFQAIESIVAHEYFHNWTGNRITCRDWFQLCLKEGLTVFRDQEFSADMRSRPVQRIKDVIRLRARQFPEDAGPLAHPVRPDSYGAIDNLYTATVYEKGAELIRMLKQLIGADNFARGLEIYFECHDGEAATIEDFYACFESASGQNLSAFRQWYAQPGTPEIIIRESWAPATATLTIEVQQSVSGNAGAEAKPLPTPLACAIIGGNGTHLSHTSADNGEFLLISDDHQVVRTLAFPAGTERPSLSVGREFSAPVILRRHLSRDETLSLIKVETDPFNRWDLSQSLVRKQILNTTYGGGPIDAGLVDTVAQLSLDAKDKDPAFAALLLRLPTTGELFLDHKPADPIALDAARKDLKSALAARLTSELTVILNAPQPTPFRPDAAQAGIRDLRSAALDLCAHHAETAPFLNGRFEAATNMTEQQAVLSALLASPEDASDALAKFYAQWAGNPLVIDKWFATQARLGRVTELEALAEHEDFDLGNPNRVRALVGVFATGNLAGFHAPDGSGHDFVATFVRRVDPRNPALAARLLTTFEQWKDLTEDARQSAERTLRKLSAAKLSQNASDILQRIIG